MNINQLILDSVIGFELAVALFGVYYIKKIRHKPLYVFVPYMWLLVILELTGMWIRHLEGNNHWVYNIQGITEFACFAFIFYHSVRSGARRSWVTGLSVIAVIIWLMDMLFRSQPYFTTFLSTGLAVSSLLLVVICCIYLVQLVQDPAVKQLKSIVTFWIAIGLIIYHTCSLPITILINLLERSELTNMLWNVPTGLSMGMYICFLFGLTYGKVSS